jgi:uncharacterized membrane protein YkvA (DUF1232 family)
MGSEPDNPEEKERGAARRVRVPQRVEVIAPGEGPRFEPEDADVVPAEVGRARPRGRQPAWSPLRRLLAHVPGVPTLVGLWAYLHHDEAPLQHKLCIAMAAAYVVWPRDLLPELRLGLFRGNIDDAAVVIGLITFIGSERLAPYRKRAKAWLRGEAGSPYLGRGD